MGSLQRSSGSLGRAGESSLQTAAHSIQQRLKKSPYGPPRLRKSQSDPAALRRQRYTTSASVIGSGVQQPRRAAFCADDVALARQLMSSGVKAQPRRADVALARHSIGSPVKQQQQADAAAARRAGGGGARKHTQQKADEAFARQLVLSEGRDEEAALARDADLARDLAARDTADALRASKPAPRERTPPRAAPRHARDLALRADVLRPRSARRRTRTPSPPPPALRDKLVERLRDFGLQEFEVLGDGNCQYRALAHQLFSGVEHHADVRRTVCRQLARAADRYRGFVATDDDLDYEAFVARMACDGEWGDHVTLQAAADAYGTRICLVTSYEDRGILRVEPTEAPPDGEEPKTAWLAFWAEIHYSSIVPMDEEGGA